MILCLAVTKNIARSLDPFTRHFWTHLIKEFTFEMLQVPAGLSKVRLYAPKEHRAPIQRSVGEGYTLIPHAKTPAIANYKA